MRYRFGFGILMTVDTWRTHERRIVIVVLRGEASKLSQTKFLFFLVDRGRRGYVRLVMTTQSSIANKKTIETASRCRSEDNTLGIYTWSDCASAVAT
jgi:hypothetical protein